MSTLKVKTYSMEYRARPLAPVRCYTRVKGENLRGALEAADKKVKRVHPRALFIGAYLVGQPHTPASIEASDRAVGAHR